MRELLSSKIEFLLAKFLTLLSRTLPLESLSRRTLYLHLPISLCPFLIRFRLVSNDMQHYCIHCHFRSLLAKNKIYCLRFILTKHKLWPLLVSPNQQYNKTGYSSKKHATKNSDERFIVQTNRADRLYFVEKAGRQFWRGLVRLTVLT